MGPKWMKWFPSPYFSVFRSLCMTDLIRRKLQQMMRMKIPKSYRLLKNMKKCEICINRNNCHHSSFLNKKRPSWWNSLIKVHYDENICLPWNLITASLFMIFENMRFTKWMNSIKRYKKKKLLMISGLLLLLLITDIIWSLDHLSIFFIPSSIN